MSIFAELPLVDIYCHKANLKTDSDCVLGEQDSADLVQICSLIMGNSLALEWTAMHTEVSSPRSTRVVLEKALRACCQTLPSDQDILQAALICALAALPSALRRFLHKVSIFAEGWSVEAASVVCEAPQAGELCEELSRRQLVSVDTTHNEIRYRLAEWVRHYLRTQLNDVEEQRLAQSHKSYFFSLTVYAAPHIHFTPDVSWINRLEADKANLLAAFECSRSEECLQFGLALWRWGYMRAHIDETCRLLHIARFACKTFPPEAKPEMYRALGSIFYRKKEYGVAKGHLEEAYHIALKQENWEEAAFSAQILAIVFDVCGESDVADSWAESSYILWQQVGSLWGQASILNDKGLSAWKQERYLEAKQLLNRSLDYWRQLNDKLQAALVLSNIGLLAETQREHEDAEKAFRQSLLYLENGPDKRRNCKTLNNLALSCYQQQKYRQATTLFCKSLVLTESICFKALLPAVLVGLGEVAHKQGNNKFAVLCFSMAEDLDPNCKDSFYPADKREFEQIIVKVRRTMRSQMYESLWSRGRKMTVEEALNSVPSLMRHKRRRNACRTR